MLFGLLGSGTVIVNIVVVAGGPEGLRLAEYLSFFTNRTNLYAEAVLAISGLVPRDRLPRWWDGPREAAAAHPAVTFVVFAVLLDGAPGARTITP
ncbi:MAG: Integral rane protein [Naasia sp.]|nr:Integral rane protein [Naasia sp.]